MRGHVQRILHAKLQPALDGPAQVRIGAEFLRVSSGVPLQIRERFAQSGKMPANDYRVCAPKRHCVSFAALPRAAAIFASWGT